MFTLDILAIPQGADSFRDWVVWGAAIVGGMVAIGVGLVKLARWTRTFLASAGYDLLEPKFNEINDKMDTLKESADAQVKRNDAQHAEVAASLDTLTARLEEHNRVLTDHLDESATAASTLADVIQAVETHIGKLRDEITSPGLPVTPAAGPPPGTKHLY